MKRLAINHRLTDRSENSFDQYLQEIKRIPMISAEEEIALAIRIQNGDKEALDKLVCSNLRFVVSVAKQYKTSDLSLNELVCEGNLGLIRAAGKFDHTKGFKFISYAVWWIRQSIIKYLTDKKRTIRLPNNFSSLQSKVNRYRADLSQILEREPTSEELSEFSEVSVQMIESLSLFMNNTISLDASYYDEDRSLHDVLNGESYDLFEKKIWDDSAKSDIKRLLKSIPDKEMVVLCYLYGLNNFEKLTMVEIAHRLGMTAEGIRQIRERGLRRLRKPHLKNQLEKYSI